MQFSVNVKKLLQKLEFVMDTYVVNEDECAVKKAFIHGGSKNTILVGTVDCNGRVLYAGELKVTGLKESRTWIIRLNQALAAARNLLKVCKEMKCEVLASNLVFHGCGSDGKDEFVIWWEVDRSIGGIE